MYFTYTLTYNIYCLQCYTMSKKNSIKISKQRSPNKNHKSYTTDSLTWFLYEPGLSISAVSPRDYLSCLLSWYLTALLPWYSSVLVCLHYQCERAKITLAPSYSNQTLACHTEKCGASLHITPFCCSRHPLLSVNPFWENRTDDNKSGMDDWASWSSRRRV